AGRRGVGAVNMAGGARNRVYGLHAVRGLLDTRPQAIAGAQVLERSADGRLAELVGRIESLNVPVRRVPRAELDRATGGGRHQGIVVDVAAPPEFTLGAFEDLVVERGSALRLL